MNKSKKIAIALVLSGLLQACGGSSSSDSKKEVTEQISTAVVHHIAPAKVAEYIETYKQQIADVEFQFEGKKYELTFWDFGPDQKSIIARYDAGAGFVTFGFDMDKESPIANISVRHPSIAQELVSATDAIKISSAGDNYVYDGQVENKSTGGLHNVRLVINESFLSAGNSTLEIGGAEAVLNGTLGTKTYVQISEMIANNPEVKKLFLLNIDGSINDAINMHTGRLIRQAQLTTNIGENGDVNSGGVDLFAAGFKREYTTGGKVGVHAWCCENGKSAHLLKKSDPAHGAQLTYFREMLGNELGPEFYFFTINAAPAESIHVMTQAELDKYLLVKN